MFYNDSEDRERYRLWLRKRPRLSKRGAVDPGGVLNGPGYRYRPRQILLEIGEGPEYQLTAEELKKHHAVVDERLTQSFASVGLPVEAFLLPPDVSIPALVSRLRRRTRSGAPVPNVGPNYVFSGEPDYQGGPAGEPTNASRFRERTFDGPADPKIAVLDTGLDPSALALHPGLADRLDFQARDEDNPVLPNGDFAAEGGHATFIAGIVMRVAPHTRIRQVKVLDPAGVGDDHTIAVGLARASAPVINLSLGGYTHDDAPPVATGVALARHTGDDVVAVAAAGNNGQDRPFWPAAFKHVVSVGAVDLCDGVPRLASFSNYGWWVDVYAPGVEVRSTYLKGVWKLPTDPEPTPIGGYAWWSGTSFATPQVASLIVKELPKAGNARRAALAVLARARWEPGLGPVLVPDRAMVRH
jgi:subtilisin family serine protease